MLENWLVIGISGVTCGGKTTLATSLSELLPNSKVISQDDYFLDVNDPRHTWILELNHINFDIISSLDMEQMHMDILATLRNRDSAPNGKVIPVPNSMLDVKELIKIRNVKVLIIEGFCIFNYKAIAGLCDVKYFFTLSEEECYRRRMKRVYEPPDCPGYFEQCAWPEYLRILEEVRNTVKDVVYFDGAKEQPVNFVLQDLLRII